MSPTDACKPENHLQVADQFKKFQPIETSNLNIGDRVRISVQKKLFEKGTTPNWTEEIFEITEIVHTRPITYRIQDLTGEQLDGAFYSEQLQKTDQEIHRVERVLRRRKKLDGTREAYVSWSGLFKQVQSMDT